MVHGALRLLLEPIFEADFSRLSFGARPGRSAHDAIGEVRSGLIYQKHLVLDVDLKSFFDDSSAVGYRTWGLFDDYQIRYRNRAKAALAETDT